MQPPKRFHLYRSRTAMLALGLACGLVATHPAAAQEATQDEAPPLTETRSLQEPAAMQDQENPRARNGHNMAKTIQFGNGNTARTSQSGDRNISVIQQHGDDNTAAIDQTGTGHVGITVQVGGGFDSTIEQSGERQTQTVIQVDSRGTASGRSGGKTVGSGQASSGVYFEIR